MGIRSAIVSASGNPMATRFRAMLRRTSAGRWMLRKTFSIVAGDYEGEVHRRLMGEVRVGDVVWDVGANVGLYTELFAEKAGPGGAVVAIEPTPASADRCRAIAAKYPNVTVVQAAISDTPGEATFTLEADPTSTTNRMGAAGATDSNTIRVEVLTGDALVGRMGRPPNVIKLDIEGFEIEALRGMARVLVSPTTRSVLVEVHFGILESRGIKDGGQRVTEMLTAAGLTTTWIDFSHILGRR